MHLLCAMACCSMHAHRLKAWLDSQTKSSQGAWIYILMPCVGQVGSWIRDQALALCVFAFDLRALHRQVFTPAGRRLLPSLHLSACAAFMSTDGAWRLLVVTTDGNLRLWDLQKLSLVVEASVLSPAQPAGRAHGRCVQWALHRCCAGGREAC